MRLITNLDSTPLALIATCTGLSMWASDSPIRALTRAHTPRPRFLCLGRHLGEEIRRVLTVQRGGIGPLAAVCWVVPVWCRTGTVNRGR